MLTGCWDARGLDELALVMAVGIDKSVDSDKFVVTVQIAKPQSQDKSNPSSDEPVWTASAEGKTLFEAIRNIAKFSSRRVMWAHNRIIVIGESMAKDDITPIIDFFTHNPELRMKTWVAVCNGKAREYVSTKTGMEAYPALSASELFNYYELSAQSVRTSMDILFRDFQSETVQPFVSALYLEPLLIKQNEGQKEKGENQVVLEGGAVFLRTKMLGFTTPEQTRGLGIVRRNISSAVLSVPTDEEEEEYVAVELNSIKVNMDSKMQGDLPSVIIDVSCSGQIVEQDFSTDLSMDAFKKQVEDKTAEILTGNIQDGIEAVQKEYKSDVLSIGRLIHINHRDLWYSKYKSNWEKIYPNIPITVNTTVKIEYSSTYQIPMNNED